MAIDPLTAAILQGLDPGVYRPLSDISQGNALQQVGMDASPTTKWGAIGRIANAAAGNYLSNSATSDLARTVARGKRSLYDEALKTLSPVPSGAPAQAAPPTMALQPAVQPRVAPAVAPEAGSPNAQVADRFPSDWSPGTAASPLPNNAASPLDTAQYPAGPNGAPSATAIAANAPRGIRNNNPLNIEAGDFTRGQPGFAGSDGRFAQFDTPENGLAAAHALLDVYDQKHGINTVNGIVGRWAPASDGNNVSTYAADVAGKLGIDPNAPVPKELRPALVAAMAQHENGVPVPGSDQAPYKVAGPAVAAPRVASQAADEEGTTAGPASSNAAGLDINKLLSLRSNPYADENLKGTIDKLILAQLTPKEHEFGSSPQGIFDKTTGELKQGAAGNYGGLQGPELMDAVKQQNPALASQVQSVLDYKSPYPTGSRLNPVQQQIKELVTQINPDFSAAKFGARANFEKNMASTVPNSFGGQVRSAGTVAKHLGDAHDALGDIESGMLGASNTLPILNSAKGFIRNQRGDESYQNATGHYNTAIKGLADEAENLLANGHGAEGSKLYWKDRLDLGKHSPTEVRGALDEFRSLMMGRVSNVAQEKDRVFDQVPGTTDPLGLFGPKERDIMKKINDDTYKGKINADGTATAAATTAAPPEKTIGSKTYFQQNGQWFEK